MFDKFSLKRLHPVGSIWAFPGGDRELCWRRLSTAQLLLLYGVTASLRGASGASFLGAAAGVASSVLDQEAGDVGEGVGPTQPWAPGTCRFASLCQRAPLSNRSSRPSQQPDPRAAVRVQGDEGLNEHLRPHCVQALRPGLGKTDGRHRCLPWRAQGLVPYSRVSTVVKSAP